MKKILFSVLTIACTLIFSAASASEGGRSGSTSSPSEGNCTSCHSDFTLNSGGGSVSVTSNIPSWSYTPGQTYTINVTIAKTGSAVFGWDLEALKSTGASGGKMLITNTTKSQILYKTVSGNSRANFVHKMDGGLANNTFTISFNWLAPTVDSGNVTLYFNGLAADHDGSEAGDYVYTGTQVITPAATSIPLVLNCASNLTVSACQTQTAINTAYNNWLATATISGGCNAALTNNSTGAPLACGGSKTVTWTATSTCGTSQSCSATFTVTAATAVVVTPTSSQNIAACQTQSTVDAAYATWLNSVTVTGGCNTYLTNNSTGAPSACGGSKSVFWIAYSDCTNPTSTSATFTVAAATPVVLTAASNQNVSACQTQAAVDAAYATWLASVTVSGGCNTSLTNNSTGAPLACGGSKTVIWTAISDCETAKTTTATFTVTAASPVVINCAADQTVAACQSQAAVNAAFFAWLTNVTVTGGCNTYMTNNGTAPPAACGGSVLVTWTAASECEAAVTCSATFTVDAATPVVVNSASNQTEASCQNQSVIDAAFTAWVASVTATGGCNTVVSNDATSAPSACGGSVTVNWTVTSDCSGSSLYTNTFTVDAPTPVVIACATDQIEAACQTQAAIDAAFNTWLNNVTVSGGCLTTLSNDAISAPLACGGSVLVTWTAANSCDIPATCSATFTVTAATPVILTCPGNQTEAACQSQAAIDAAYNLWLASVSVSGGCNTNLTFNSSVAPVAPSACGGSKTITWTATSDCQAPVTCNATFTVNATSSVVLNCIGNQSLASGNSQATVDAAYAIWLASTNFTGGCNGVLTNNSTGAPLATGGSTTVTFTVSSGCEADITCNATFTVSSSTPVITATPAKLTGFTTSVGGYSPAQTFAFSADFLSNDVKLVAPAEYQISLTGVKGTWVKNIIVPKDINGQVALTTVYVRYHPTVAGDAKAYVRLMSNGITYTNVRVVGTTNVIRLGSESASELVVTLTPNPTVNTLNLNISNTDQNSTVTLFDLTGNKLQSMVVASGSLAIDVSNLPQGLYFCRIESGSNVIVKKFVKQ